MKRELKTMNDEVKKDKSTNQVKEQSETYGEFERYEIIGGIRYDFLSSPKVMHQVISAEIEHILRSRCQPDGVILHAPMDVHLDEDNVVQPDIIYIVNHNLQIIIDQKIKGTPDLLIEILSPSTGSRDRVIKKELYERFRVQEYWIVDPVHFTIEQFVLSEDGLNLHAAYGHGSTLKSPHFLCIAIDMDKLYKQVERFIPKD
jgi:Uma2 family endonuclease